MDRIEFKNKLNKYNISLDEFICLVDIWFSELSHKDKYLLICEAENKEEE